jgi:predicted enzyme related to lactoylglutathione lyase
MISCGAVKIKDAMLVNRSAPPGSIVPVLIYQDVAKAIDWLSGAFGFTERLRTAPEPDGTIHHAQLAIGPGSIILTGRSVIETRARPCLYVPVADVDAHFERAQQFGARIVDPPKTHQYGERQYNAEDLEGYNWTFSQSVCDVNPEEWDAKVADIQAPARPRPSFCYLQIPAADTGRSLAFYEKVFGWKIRHRDSGHPSFDDASGHISGAWVTDRSVLLPYIWVDDLEDTLARAAKHGAAVVEAPHPDHPGGSSWIALFRDPAGNVIGLYQEDHPALS